MLIFEPYLDIVNTLSDKLRAEGANAVILLPHFGPLCSSDDTLKNDLRNKDSKQGECASYKEYNQLMQSLEKGKIDAVVTAHIHDISHYWIADVPVVQTNGAFNSHVIYLLFKEESGKYTLVNDQIKIEGPLPACEKIFTNTKRCDYVPQGEQGELMNYKYHEVEIKLDSTMKSLLDNWREMIDEKLKNIIVENEETLTIDYTQETALANLVTNVGKRITGADISLFNLGGFRTEWYPGKLNEIDLFEMFPFDNKFVMTAT